MQGIYGTPSGGAMTKFQEARAVLGMTRDLATLLYLERLRQRLPERRDPFVNLWLSRSSHSEVEEEIAEGGKWE